MDVLLFVASSTLVTLVQARQQRRHGSSMGQSLSSKTASSATAAATLLLQAAVQGDLDRIRALVAEHTTSSSSSSSNNTNNNDNDDDKSIASFLNQLDASGNAAMHGAVFGGHLQVVQYLHQQQASSSSVIVLTLPNGLGCTPLWLAAGYDRGEILEYLLEHIVIPNNDKNNNNNNNTIRREALLAANSTGDTPLLAAASKGHAAACRRLLRAADAVAVDEYFQSEMAQTVNQSGDSPLAVAIAAGIQDETLLDQLIRLSSSSSNGGGDADDDGDASKNNNNNNNDSILNRPNAKGITPLLVACERDHVAAVKKLLPLLPPPTTVIRTNAASSSNSNNGDTPLGVAAFCGSERVLKVLLEQHRDKDTLKAILNQRPQHPRGCTPLFLAVRAGHVNCARLLLEAGADPTVPGNREGLTPLQAAAKFKARPALMELLQQQPQEQSSSQQ